MIFLAWSLRLFLLVTSKSRSISNWMARLVNFIKHRFNWIMFRSQILIVHQKWSNIWTIGTFADAIFRWETYMHQWMINSDRQLESWKSPVIRKDNQHEVDAVFLLDIHCPTHSRMSMSLQTAKAGWKNQNEGIYGLLDHFSKFRWQSYMNWCWIELSMLIDNWGSRGNHK